MKSRKTHILSLSQKAEKALKEAVRNVIKDHKRTGDPLLVWRHGKVVKISPNHL
ncbi:MAG: hypothetical protein WC592_06975 [Candidatus Omnitrophota bacterium]